MKFLAPPNDQLDRRTTLDWIKNSWAFRLATVFTIINTLFSVTFIIWHWKTLPPAVPLWYSRPWGEERLAHPLLLFLLPATCLFIYLFNLLLTFQFVVKHTTFAKIFYLTSALVNIISLIALVKIITLIS